MNAMLRPMRLSVADFYNHKEWGFALLAALNP